MTDKIVSHAIEQGIDFLFANRLSGQVTLGSAVALKPKSIIELALHQKTRIGIDKRARSLRSGLSQITDADLGPDTISSN